MNNEYKYAYAVARVRAAENKLLSRSTFDMLVSATDITNACRILTDNGWSISNDGDCFKALNQRMNEVWDFLCESVPDKKELEILTVENDFHNIKAAVKCIFSTVEPDSLYLRPTVLDLDKLNEMSKLHDFSLLPEYAAFAAQKAYEIGVETGNGQKIDITLDIACLNRLYELSCCSKCSSLKEICSVKLAAADIKTAVRSALYKKDRDFLVNALCECEGLSIDELAGAGEHGADGITSYLEKTKYYKAVKPLKDGNASFEKWADDTIMQLVKTAKWKSLGYEPIIAYFYANSAEIKNVRIILGSKINGSDNETVRQRVRELYV